ncbi:hypothetical protein Trebr_2401 [Treponema brennaborense DSM 12168]|uniref:Uncharacterized protein n=1 Tax=Treponema brennaborense (strain DSM 12168 / CIP 105900 / DD5/3) TaxID=906968 RepID=F4LMR8_TREBD|nr:hypothetical protein Trebr_2401 [Treponema brennaborense DSM 12168]
MTFGALRGVCALVPAEGGARNSVRARGKAFPRKMHPLRFAFPETARLASGAVFQ